MEKRQQVLTELREYIERIDQESTLLLQTIQWDRIHLTQQSVAIASCKYDSNHRIPLTSKEVHEKQCFLKHEGYNNKDVLLPEPVDPSAKTVVTLSKQDIIQIINEASSLNASFKRVSYRLFPDLEKFINIICVGSKGAEPLSLDRLQQVYTADERRAIHDAVVKAAPFCHDLSDLALSSSNNDAHGKKVKKSNAEVLAELRDMKRRRAKYRVAAKTSNYSNVLRDVIKTQMELYAEAKGILIKTEYGSQTFISVDTLSDNCNEVQSNIVIKQERMTPDPDADYHYSRKYKDRSRDRSNDSYRRKQHDEDKRRDHYEHKSTTDRRRYDNVEGNRHNPTRDRRRLDYDRSTYDKHKSYEDELHKDRQSKRNSHSSQGVDKDYKNAKTHKTKYDTSSKGFHKYKSHREGESSRDSEKYSKLREKYNKN